MFLNGKMLVLLDSYEKVFCSCCWNVVAFVLSLGSIHHQILCNPKDGYTIQNCVVSFVRFLPQLLFRFCSIFEEFEKGLKERLNEEFDPEAGLT